jgi:hypothetical protein
MALIADGRQASIISAPGYRLFQYPDLNAAEAGFIAVIL